MTDRIDEYLEDCLDREAEALRRHSQMVLDLYGPQTESPIERLMLAALAFMETPIYFDQAVLRHWPPIVRPVVQEASALEQVERALPATGRDVEAVILIPQARILEYRVDFLLLAKFSNCDEICRVVVECDGHEFHERTKEQAQRDRSRDRRLLAAGYHVFRFTGSEIYRDPDKCVEEVRRYLDARAQGATLA